MNLLSASPSFDVGVITEVIGFLKEGMSILLTAPVSYFLGIGLVCSAFGIFAVAKKAAR